MNYNCVKTVINHNKEKCKIGNNMYNNNKCEHKRTDSHPSTEKYTKISKPVREKTAKSSSEST